MKNGKGVQIRKQARYYLSNIFNQKLSLTCIFQQLQAKSFFPTTEILKFGIFTFLELQVVDEKYHVNDDRTNILKKLMTIYYLLIGTKIATWACFWRALYVKHPVQAFISTTQAAIYRRFALANHDLLCSKR